MQAAYENTGCNERNLYSSTNTIPAISSLKFCTKSETSMLFLHGIRDAFPIGLGYFAVSFSLGIAASMAGLNWIQGMFLSLLNNASAGEYALFTLIGANAAYWELALVTLITNARYFLMSCALSQKLAPDMKNGHRFLLAQCVTDEIFGLSSMVQGTLDPVYTYGITIVSVFGWVLGTVLGVLVGNILPPTLADALAVALYGMFLAIIIPPAKRDLFIAGLVAIAMAASWLFSTGLFGLLPALTSVSDGFRVIILTVLIAGIAAVLKPIPESGSYRPAEEITVGKEADHA